MPGCLSGGALLLLGGGDASLGGAGLRWAGGETCCRLLPELDAFTGLSGEGDPDEDDELEPESSSAGGGPFLRGGRASSSDDDSERGGGGGGFLC